MIIAKQEFVASTDVRHHYSPGACVPEMVTAAAAERPETVAVTEGCQALTYHGLQSRSNRLARYLRSLGVGADVLVGLCLPRSLDMVVGALGIWKAGGAYVPMDPAYPADRLAFILDDAQAPVLVTNPSLGRRLPVSKRELVNIDAPQVTEQVAESPHVEIVPVNLAYVIYTSGSTGRPKGVEITHGGLANLVSWHVQTFSVNSADRASHVAGLGFDAAVWELWPYLATGASVHLANEVTRSSAEPLRDWLLAQEITISFVPTPLAERLLNLQWPRKTTLRILLTGGDTLHHYPPADLPFVVVNNYGPTECGVVATSGPVLPNSSPEGLPPIGCAIANTQVYLLDEHLVTVPAGTPGEIHIGGAGLARGYHNQADLSREKFIPNPFSAEPGSRLYKTGDLARLLPGGQIAFLSRIDDQIKIRGYRIETNEIVSVLERHPAVRESLVVAREDAPGDKLLVAYVVMDPKAGVTGTALRDFLREYLPDYMVPAAFVWLDTLPLTPHGKVDRTALPAPDPANTIPDEASAGPSTPVERRIAEIVGVLLGRNEIGRTDNFFLIGGHSLLGAQLIARLRDAFGAEVSLRTLFEAPTVAALAAEIGRLGGSEVTLKGSGVRPSGSARACTDTRL